MKTKKYVANYAGLAVGSAVIAGVGGAAGKQADGVTSMGLSGMNILAAGNTAMIGMDLVGDLGKMGRKKGRML